MSPEIAAAFAAVGKLCEKFEADKDFYLSDSYKEVDARTDFIDQLFNALGWSRSSNPYQQEMKIEQGGQAIKGRADYAFSLAPDYNRVRFFVEAKRPQRLINTPENCFQAIRYSWPQSLPISVLTDFQYVHIIDTRFRPTLESATRRIVRSWHYRELQTVSRFLELYWLLSREAVAGGSIEAFTLAELPADQVATTQYSLFPGETKPFDEEFLQQLDDWRRRLAVSFKRTDRTLTGSQLTECVQRTLDRLVFISFLQDKGIELDPIISKFGLGKRTSWRDFVATCSRLDATYNGIVFKRHNILDDPQFEPDKLFSEVCDELSDRHSPYDFNSIPIEILGRIYERFLGSVVKTRGASVEVTEKSDVRRAGGVYYTPDYVVKYIAENSIRPHIRGKSAREILKTRIIDTSCGSGSFLIAAFSILLDAVLDFYRRRPKEAPKGALDHRDGAAYITLSLRRQILVNCIFGVDIDQQAVEVAQLSLYLKLMENETPFTAQQQQVEMGVALLPSLNSNVVVGNSLVTLEDSGGDLFADERLNQIKSLDFRRVFRQVFADGGFSVVLGNPPYIKEFTNRDAFEFVRSSAYYQGKMDIWYLFACRGVDWLRDGGTLGLIATNNWVTNSGARKLREKISSEMTIRQLVDFGNFRVFRDASIQTMILIAEKRPQTAPYTFDYRKLAGLRPSQEQAQHLLEKAAFPSGQYLTATMPSNSAGSPMTFSDDDAEGLLSRISERSNFRLEAREIAQGIVAPQDRLNRAGHERLRHLAMKSRSEVSGSFEVGEGIFVLTTAEKNALKLSKSEEKLLKPYYTTSELQRFEADGANKQWVIYTDSRFGNPEEMSAYPRLKRHLSRFSPVITSAYGPYGLHRARNERFFVGEKVIATRKCGRPTFTHVDFDCYVSQTFNVIKTDRINLLFLTGVLNSGLIQFWLAHRGKMQGDNYQIDSEPLLALPLVSPEKTAQKEIADIVSRIIRKRRLARTARTQGEADRWAREAETDEAEIEDKVADLYGLTQSDREMIEEFCRPRGAKPII